MRKLVKLCLIALCIFMSSLVTTQVAFAVSIVELDDPLLVKAQKRLKTLESSGGDSDEIALLREGIDEAINKGKLSTLKSWQSLYSSTSSSKSNNNKKSGVSVFVDGEEINKKSSSNNSDNTTGKVTIKNSNATTNWQPPVYAKNGWVMEDGKFRLYYNDIPFPNQPPNEHGWASDANGWGYQVVQQPVPQTQNYHVSVNTSVSSSTNNLSNDVLDELLTPDGTFDGEIFTVASTVNTNNWKGGDLDKDYSMDFDESWSSSGKYWFVNKEIEAGSGKGIWAEWQSGQWYFITETTPVSYSNDNGDEKQQKGAYAIVEYFQDEFALIDGQIYQFNEYGCSNKKSPFPNVKFNKTTGKVTSGYSVESEDIQLVSNSTKYEDGIVRNYDPNEKKYNDTDRGKNIQLIKDTTENVDYVKEIKNIINQLIAMVPSLDNINQREKARNMVSHALNLLENIPD